MRYIVLLLSLIILLPLISGAKIQGMIYDFELDILNKSVISIGPSNKQIYVSRDGTYTLNVPIGEYNIIARRDPNLISRETIIVDKEGNYSLDLVLRPESELLMEETPSQNSVNNTVYYLIGVLIALFIFGSIIYFFKKKKKVVGDDELTSQVVSIIKKEGGRINQKDLRKQMPYSEAKISLIISELEKKDKIKKLKKGRGNIIILKD